MNELKLYKTLAVLEGCLEYAHQSLGETIAEYRSEVAMFGDAWPGADADIAACKDRVNTLTVEMNAFTARNPLYFPPAWALARVEVPPCAADNDLPF